jgi:16S rRNA (uracil1498-N3)-methyltransferase
MAPGDNIVVLDNSGSEWQVRLTEVGKDSVRGRLVDRQPGRGEPDLQLTLFQGTLKAQKFEWVLQKGTELGVSRFVPTVCRRSVAHNFDTLAKKRARWQRIVREAAEQSGRGRLPRLEPAILLPDAFQDARSNQLRLMLWEEAAGPALKQVLAGVKARAISIFIGPEGGFTADEAALARQSGLQPVKLGPRILRAETAGIAVSSVVLYEMDEWNQFD